MPSEPWEEIAARLGAASGPDRELDAEIWWAQTDHSEDDGDIAAYAAEHGGIATLKHVFGSGWRDWKCIPRYTASVDAIIALIAEKLPGWGHGHILGPGMRLVTGNLIAPPQDINASITDGRGWARHFESAAATPALALAAAFCRAMAHQAGAEVG